MSSTAAKEKLKSNIWWLSLTSFLVDISSEMILPILPIFLRSVLGASFSLIGFIEGLAEGLGSFLKYFSGFWSDRLQKRKGLTLTGYGLSAVSRLFFVLTSSVATVGAFRVLDRMGKGIRTSPRDALIALSVGPKEKGKFFGIHRASDTAGAVIGTLIAAFFLFYFQEQIASAMRLLLLLSFIPALLGVLFLIFVREPAIGLRPAVERRLFHFGRFSPRFKLFLVIAALYGLANYSYSFYLLRASDLGIAIITLPWIYLLYNLVYAFSSYPAGNLSDKIGRRPVLVAAFLLFALVNLGFAFVTETWFLWPLFALYGLFIGATDSVFRAFVSDLARREEQGEAFGLYHSLIGLTTIVGNLVAGLSWELWGVVWPFAFSAALILAAALILNGARWE